MPVAVQDELIVVQEGKIYKIIAVCLEHNFTKIITLVIYLVYLGLSINYIIQLPLGLLETFCFFCDLEQFLGLDLKFLTPDGSFVADELRAQEHLFSDYGAFCFCIIYTNNELLYQEDQRQKIIALYHQFTNGTLVSKADFWLEVFEDIHKEDLLHVTSHKDFIDVLTVFLNKLEYSKYQTDIRFNATGNIEAIKMIMRVRKLGPENDDPRAEFLRSHMASSGLNGFVYDTSFLLVDQQSVTRRNVIVNVLIAISVMLLISVMFAPRPMSVLAIALSILSINVGVVGALSVVKTRLDIISMITIIMSVGFSRTLQAVAYPIIQAALSTFIGVSILGVVPSYMIRTFVLTVVFVVCIGLLHALYFLPVLLDFAVPKTEYLVPYSSQKKNINEHVI